jgi:predicted nucleotidyltransferase
MELKIDENVFKKHGVALAFLFGSQVKGNAAQTSDFDIAVLFETPPADPLALKETALLASDLDGYFPANIDVVSLHRAPLLLKYEVIAHNRVLYCENEKERIDFEVSVIKEYADEEPVRRFYNQALYKRILQEGV